MSILCNWMKPSSWLIGEEACSFGFFAPLALAAVSWSPPMMIRCKEALGTWDIFPMLGMKQSSTYFILMKIAHDFDHLIHYLYFHFLAKFQVVPVTIKGSNELDHNITEVQIEIDVLNSNTQGGRSRGCKGCKCTLTFFTGGAMHPHYSSFKF